MNRTCTIEGCDRGGYMARGMCSRCYAKWRHRNPDAPTVASLRPPLGERLRQGSAVDLQTGCWTWSGYRLPSGYAYMSHNGKPEYVHRLSWEAFRGPIPEGLQIDHLCRNRGCVNPDHLEPVTGRENVRRAIAYEYTGECRRGHEMTPENLYVAPSGYRNCRKCRRLRDQRKQVSA